MLRKWTRRKSVGQPHMSPHRRTRVRARGRIHPSIVCATLEELTAACTGIRLSLHLQVNELDLPHLVQFAEADAKYIEGLVLAYVSSLPFQSSCMQSHLCMSSLLYLHVENYHEAIERSRKVSEVPGNSDFRERDAMQHLADDLRWWRAPMLQVIKLNTTVEKLRDA